MSSHRLDKVLAYLDAGEYEAAAQLLKLMALKRPADIDLQHLSGVAAAGLGQLERAGMFFERVLKRQPQHAGALYGEARRLLQLSRPGEALALLNRAIADLPGQAWLYLIRGNAHAQIFDYGAARDDFQQVLVLEPAQVEAQANLANAWAALGQPAEALAAYRRALQLRPEYAEAWFNQGAVLAGQGRHEEALESLDHALRRQANLAAGWTLRGDVLRRLDRLEEACESYHRGLQHDPEPLAAGLACREVLNALDRPAQALTLCHALLERLPDQPAVRQAYAEQLESFVFTVFSATDQHYLTRAFEEAWGHPARLSRVAASLLACAPAFAGLLDAPSQTDFDHVLAEDGRLAALAKNELLAAWLRTTPVCDVRFESFLTRLRRCLLARTARWMEAAEPVCREDSALLILLGHQGFIHEYLLEAEADEQEQAGHLRERLANQLAQGGPVDLLLLAGVAAYGPLYTIPGSARLLEFPSLPELKGLIDLQVAGPLREAALKSTLPCLTPIDDPISQRVRQQYEENPYPRWICLVRDLQPRSIEQFLAERFPAAPRRPLCRERRPDILIAGCGTGQHPLQTAQMIEHESLLAIDLSLASLAYAQRKSQELGVDSITFAQADILALGGLEKRFDVIEAIGVLHHLQAPLDAWRQLLVLLRAEGVMQLGFYSALADRPIDEARAHIEAAGLQRDPAGIRAARALLRAANTDGRFDAVLELNDFYSLSECRDLLFHVQETRLSLATLQAFLAENDLNFLGFELPSTVLAAYARRFPDDPARTDLAAWAVFENEHPRTFAGMYRFWVQKPVGETSGH